MTVQNSNFNRQYISIELIPGNQSMDVGKKLCEIVSNIFTSDENIDFETCKFHIQVVKIPRGSENSRRILNLAKDKCTKKCIMQIRNNDNLLCCPRAIIVGLTYYSNTILDRECTANEIKLIRTDLRRLQTDFARELCDWLGEYNEEAFTLEDIRNVKNLFNIQIKIIRAESFNSVIYKGAEKDVIVHLYKSGNHFDLITSVTAFFGSSYYCKKCHTPLSTDRQKTHRCKKDKKVCELCMKEEHSPLSKNKVYCPQFNRYCYNQTCFGDHEFSVCYVAYKCTQCSKICLHEDEHRRGWTFCFNCK